MNRREFLELAGGAAALSALEGCATWPGATGGGSAMTNFAVAPMETIRIGYIGIGERGMAAVHRIATIPGVEVAALCDLRPEAVEEARKWLSGRKTLGAMREYKGREDSWKGVCDDPGVDVVYICTPAGLHAEMELYALAAGKHVLVEVPGAQTIDECWAIVEASEKARRHCMMLENCVYGETEMLAWNLCHLGLLGTLTHAEGAYIHNLVWRHLENSFRNRKYKPGDVVRKYGNTYPTHPLGPICTYMDMNRGDRMERISSFSSLSAAHAEFAAATYGADEWQNKLKWLTGDINTSIIKTAKGRTIMLQLDMSTPRPYSRINLVQGTKGFFRSFPGNAPLALLAKTPGSETECELYESDVFQELRDKYDHPLWRKYDGKPFRELREKHKHPLWRDAEKAANIVGGHGGMDYMMDLRWVWCLRKGLSLDMDVYDLASWSAVVPCSAASDRRGGEPVDLPDFTRGALATAKPQDFGTVDLGDMGIDPGKLEKDMKQLNV